MISVIECLVKIRELFNVQLIVELISLKVPEKHKQFMPSILQCKKIPELLIL